MGKACELRFLTDNNYTGNPEYPLKNLLGYHSVEEILKSNFLQRKNLASCILPQGLYWFMSSMIFMMLW